MDLDDITLRLLQAEAKADAMQMQLDSHLLHLWKLMELLHRKGTLSMQDVAAELQSGDAFARGAFGKLKSPVHQELIQSLREIADALPRFQQR